MTLVWWFDVTNKVSNSSDTSFTNSLTTNLHFFYENECCYLHKQTNSVSWKLCRFVVTENSWNHLMNSILSKNFTVSVSWILPLQSHPVNPTSHWQIPVLSSHFPLLEHPLGQTDIWAVIFKSVIPLLFQNCWTVLRIGSLWLKGISEHSVWFKFFMLSEQPSSNQLKPPWQGLYENRLVVRPFLISISKSRPSYTSWKKMRMINSAYVHLIQTKVYKIVFTI